MTITPASIRNKNPGAQEPGPSSRKFGSTSHEVLRWTYKGKPATNKIATFPTGHHGAAAMFDLLNRKYTGKTIEKAISTWCGGYYAGAYAKALEANGGVKPTDKLTKELVANPDFAIPLCKAMARVEAGRDFPMTDDEWLEAHRMAFSNAVAPEFTPDNDVPSPGPKARAMAAINDKKKEVAGGIAVVELGRQVINATSQKQPEPQKTEAPPPSKPTTKEQVAKAKETAKEVRETVEVATDYFTWGKGIAVAAYDQWMLIVPLTLIAAAAIFWPRIRERF